MLKPDCTTRVEGISVPHIVTLKQYGISRDGSIIGAAKAPRFLFFVSKVSSSYLRLLNISTPYVISFHCKKFSNYLILYILHQKN